jgi:hypothetical protein
MDLSRTNTLNALQGGFHGIGTSRAVHALHHQHRLQATLLVTRHGLGEIGLLNLVV